VGERSEWFGVGDLLDFVWFELEESGKWGS
jgi:hypothetical protein